MLLLLFFGVVYFVLFLFVCFLPLVSFACVVVVVVLLSLNSSTDWVIWREKLGRVHSYSVTGGQEGAGGVS